MTDQAQLSILMPAAMRAALQARADELGLTVGAIVVRAVAAELGQPELMASVRPRGRPRKPK
jgi:hypothetical protein